jgi:hypothetical protein
VGSVYSIFPLLADCDVEKILKRLIGKTDVEEAFLRLDVLTKEECLMIVTRNLEVAHHIDTTVTATRGLSQNIDNNVKVIKWVARGMDHSVKATKDGAQCSSSLTCSTHIPILLPIVYQNSHG